LGFDLIDDDKVNLPPVQAVFSGTEKPLFKGEVLVCEDNALNQQVIREHLQRVGLDVVVANNGREGVDFVKSRLKGGLPPFGLIFMDMHMPVMDGLEATAAILDMFSGGSAPPVVALTANVMADAVEIYEKSGITGTIGKPFTAQELWGCLIKYFPNQNYSFSDNPVYSPGYNSGLPADSDEMQLQEMQRIFVKEHQQTYGKIVTALETGDLKKAHRLVHSLRSNAAYIRETRLAEECAAAEYALANGQGCAEHMAVIKPRLDTILGRLAHLL
jgi:CheY-like chemotaxis protein